jgi:hypothetical protein
MSDAAHLHPSEDPQPNNDGIDAVESSVHPEQSMFASGSRDQIHPSETEQTSFAEPPLVADESTRQPEVSETAADVPVSLNASGTAESTEAIEARSRAQIEANDEQVLAASRMHTRRSFVVAAAGVAAGYGFYHYLNVAHPVEMQPKPLREAFNLNAAASRALFHNHALAPTYPLSRAENLRVNGVYGLKKTLKPESWRLQLVGANKPEQHPGYTKDVTAWEYQYIDEKSAEDAGHDTKVDPKLESSAKMAKAPVMTQAKEDENHTGRKPRGLEEAGESYSTLLPGTPGVLLTMDELLSLPRHELVTQFKCIEGWSQIVHWAGIRMSDFFEAYPPAMVDGKEPRYVYMETPDGDYYNGYELDALRHPQALLVTEMMGSPLTQFHGAPLRLHLPTKYGYKQIKRIGLIAYTNAKPDDYWTELGYDWYASL